MAKNFNETHTSPRNPVNISCGKRIQALRLAMGMTQEVMAEKMNVSVRYLSQVETGERGLSVKNAKNLSRILEVSLDYLYMGVHNVNGRESVLVELEEIMNRSSVKQKTVLIDILKNVCRLICIYFDV